MRLRAPAYPLITVDPYFSVWSMGDRLNGDDTRHWTEKSQPFLGTVRVDGGVYVFMGDPKRLNLPALTQVSVDVDAFSTTYVFEGAGIRLTAAFTSPLLPDDMELISRPVSYLRIGLSSADGAPHEAAVTISAGEELCADRRGVPVLTEEIHTIDRIACIRMGTREQPVLGRSGDDLRIDWGYFHLCADGNSHVSAEDMDGMTWVSSETLLHTDGPSSALIAFAYDDLYSIAYFHERLQAYWKRNGQTIEEAIAAAYREYGSVMERCRVFGETLQREAAAAGGEQYAELLALSLRQVVAAHKLVLDAEDKVLFISKECFSNGCAATVDVSYPSIPLFLLYNPELVKGMMRPILRYAGSGSWPFAFAPHDCGRYPILNGQFYSKGTHPKNQMPVEECGNMLVMAAAVTAVEKDASFAAEHRVLLDQWAEYLLGQGMDPDNQLCTDDFAGHLAHNCNLSLKAIAGLGAYAEVCRMLSDEAAASRYSQAAHNMAEEWVRRASNGHGSYRLAFDRPGTFSMKYNMVWDLLFGLGLFPPETRRTETASYAAHMNPYGLPLDNRADYTKSDWLVWTATLTDTRGQFMEMVAPLWLAYHKSPSRVPLTDWYSTVTSLKTGFQNRTVQGGLFIKLLTDKALCRFDRGAQ